MWIILGLCAIPILFLGVKTSVSLAKRTAEAIGHFAESHGAAAQNRAAHGIPTRDLQAKPGQADLSAFYSAALTDDVPSGELGNDLSRLPQGLQTLAGIEFDVRGVVQLSASSLQGTERDTFPPTIKGIPINRKVARLHFLHGAVWHETAGVEVGCYRLHYANGQTEELSIRYGEDVIDWWGAWPQRKLEALPYAEIAWSDTGPKSKIPRRLYRRSWDNPLPEVMVKSLEFTSVMKKSAPFLIAITVTDYTPETPDSWILKANQFAKQGNLSEAVAALEQGIQKWPQNPEFWSAQGQLWATTNRLDEAEQSLTKAIQLAGADTNRFQAVRTDALLSRSSLLRRMSRWAEALEDMSALAPGEARLLRNSQNDHYYQRIEQTMLWSEAKQFCEGLGGHLATVTDRAENEFIYQYFGRDHLCWLGASDEGHVGECRWVGWPTACIWEARRALRPNSIVGRVHTRKVSNEDRL